MDLKKGILSPLYELIILQSKKAFFSQSPPPCGGKDLFRGQ